MVAMSDVLVRSVPERVTRFFRDEARAHGRSMQQELLETLSEYASQKIRRRRAIDDARRIRQRSASERPEGLAVSDSVDLLREDRGR